MDFILQEHATRSLWRCMTEISEECWCAGWLSGNEHSLWALTIEGGGKYGTGYVQRSTARGLAIMALTGGYWWVWDDEAGDTIAVPLAHFNPDAKKLLFEALSRMTAEEGMDDMWDDQCLDVTPSEPPAAVHNTLGEDSLGTSITYEAESAGSKEG